MLVCVQQELNFIGIAEYNSSKFSSLYISFDAFDSIVDTP
jgi:hypothetical protein